MWLTLRGPHGFTFHPANESDTPEQSRLSSNFKLVSHFWTTLPGARHGLRLLFYKHCDYPVNGTIIFVCVCVCVKSVHLLNVNISNYQFLKPGFGISEFNLKKWK